MLSPNEPLPPDFAFNFPADLKHVVSYTTLKVLEGGNIPTLVTKNVHEMRAIEKEMEVVEDVRVDDSEAKTYHRILHCPVVKKETSEKPRYDKPSLDISLPHVCIFFSLALDSLEERFSLIDSNLSSPENSSHCSNQSTSQPTKVHGDEQLTKFRA